MVKNKRRENISLGPWNKHEEQKFNIFHFLFKNVPPLCQFVFSTLPIQFIRFYPTKSGYDAHNTNLREILLMADETTVDVLFDFTCNQTCQCPIYLSRNTFFTFYVQGSTFSNLVCLNITKSNISKCWT